MGNLACYAPPVVNKKDEKYYIWQAEKHRFIPIKSERDKFVDAAIEQFDAISDSFRPVSVLSLKELFQNMYYAGFRVPEQTK